MRTLLRSPRRLAAAGLGLLIAIQFVPVWAMQTNPPTLAEPAWDSPRTRELARRACFDCHSNQTEWPLYTRVAPFSWLATWDVVRGRRELNFSEWGASSGGEAGEAGEAGEVADESAEQIQEGKMPPWFYLPLHPGAQLTPAEQQELINGLRLSLR